MKAKQRKLLFGGELVAPLSVPVNTMDNFVPYQQFLLTEELQRYHTLNPVRRMLVWFTDVKRAVSRKPRRLKNRRLAANALRVEHAITPN